MPSHPSSPNPNVASASEIEVVATHESRESRDARTTGSLTPASAFTPLVLEALRQNGVIVTDSGLVFTETVPFKECCKIISLLGSAENVASNYFRACLGDAYNHIKWKYGEKESQCEDIFGKGMYHNIRQYSWVFGQSSLFPTASDRVKGFAAPYKALYILRSASPSLQNQWKRIIAKGEGVTIARVELDVKAEKQAQKSLDALDSDPEWSGGSFGAVGDKVAEKVEAEAAGKPPTQTIAPSVVEEDSSVPGLSDLSEGRPDGSQDIIEDGGSEPDEADEADEAGADGMEMLDVPLPAGQTVEYVSLTTTEMAYARACFLCIENETPGRFANVDRMVGANIQTLYSSLVARGLMDPDAWLDYKRKERKNGYGK